MHDLVRICAFCVFIFAKIVLIFKLATMQLNIKIINNFKMQIIKPMQNISKI